MNPDYHIGVDLGGTNVRAGIVSGNSLIDVVSKKINAQAAAEDVLQQIFQLIDSLIRPGVNAIGIGVPGLVDEDRGIVYDVVYIPSWSEIPLRERMQDRYGIPVFINNDANCFALGEFYFGKGRDAGSMVGVTIGTGLGTGIIINEKLYAGASGGAGEFGMIDYLDQCYEYYASGQFFKNVYAVDGEVVFNRAKEGDEEAIRMYGEMGKHLGKAIRMILYALDVDLIVVGGSVRHAFTWFQKSMWEQINTIAYQRAAKRLRVEVSELVNSGILGAAALYRDAQIRKLKEEKASF